MKFRLLMISLAAALLLPTLTAAAESPPSPPSTKPVPKVKMTPQQFPALVAYLDQQMGSGKRFPVSRTERAHVDQLLQNMNAYLAGHESVDELNPQQLTEVFNWQGQINEILNKAQARGDRMVCEAQGLVGSHMKTMACITARQRERMQSFGHGEAVKLEQFARGCDYNSCPRGDAVSKARRALSGGGH